ncbi:hypothetical protein [Pseudomonas sp. LB3P14]
MFKVGTVVCVVRILSMIWPEPAACGVSTWFGGAWVSGSIIERRLTIEQGIDIEKDRSLASLDSSYKGTHSKL